MVDNTTSGVFYQDEIIFTIQKPRVLFSVVFCFQVL